MSLQTQSMLQQGYCRLTRHELESLKWGLRFTPTVCMMGSAYALWTNQPALLFALAAMGIVPFWFPDKHPVDLFYNHVVAPLLGATKLPPNPLPRRIACVSGGAMNILAAALLLSGQVTLAYVVGVSLFVLQVIVNTTHFCFASYLIEVALKAVGRSLPVELVGPAEARGLVDRGGVLVDVRDPSEFALGALPGARNIPLGVISQHVEDLKRLEVPLILYCEKGGRSRMAHGLLIQRGVCGLYNLGGIARWDA